VACWSPSVVEGDPQAAGADAGQEAVPSGAIKGASCVGGCRPGG
jgi:hypothetical protein